MPIFVTSLDLWIKGLRVGGMDGDRLLFIESFFDPNIQDPLSAVARLIDSAPSAEAVIERAVSERLPPMSVDGSEDTVARWCRVSAVVNRALHLIQWRTRTANLGALHELAFDDGQRQTPPPWNASNPGGTTLPSTTGPHVDIGTPVVEFLARLRPGPERAMLDSLATESDRRFRHLANGCAARFSTSGSFGIQCGLEAWLYYLLSEEARNGYLDWRRCQTCGRHFRANRRGRPRMYCERTSCWPSRSRAARDRTATKPS